METFKDLIKQRERRIVIQSKLRLGYLSAAVVTNVNKAWGAGTTNEWTVRRLFAKFRSGVMGIDYKPGAGHSVWCVVDHLRQDVKTQSTSKE
ncbi:hypothetical protein TNCV_3076751 [Trichonephila clavipes]|nr:hypothetical protein TNCV_3076751 [Trichonephila clavipes]